MSEKYKMEIGAGMQVDEKKKNEIEDTQDKEFLIKDTGPKFGCRHVQMLLLAGALMSGFATRINLSMAIVAMTDNTTSPNPDVPTYDWNNTSVILSSFFWSYICLQILAGYLGKTYGPKYFLLVFFFVNCCACGLTPLAAAKFGSTGVMLCRICQGIGQGFLFPSVNVLLGRWVPEQERTTLNNIVMAGIPLSSIFSSLLTGYISASWWGWPASFYILSGIGICWCVVWLCFGQNNPASHPRISDQEKNYIQTSLKQHDNQDIPVPWKKILTCVPFYALLAAHIGCDWGWGVMMTETPTYLSKVMNFNVESNALISAITSAISLFLGLTIGPLSDWIISRKILSTKNARRICNSIGIVGQSVCLISLSFLQSSQASWAPYILGLSSALSIFTAIGSAINHLDLSPRFSGVIYGILNCIGQMFSLLAPLSANWIVTDPTNASQWQIVFLIAAGFFMFGAIAFFFFMSATRQSWDGPEELQREEKGKKISVVSLMSL